MSAIIDKRIVKRREDMTRPPAINAGIEKDTPFTVGPQIKEVVSSMAVAMPTVTTIDEKRSCRGGRFKIGLMNTF